MDDGSEVWTLVLDPADYRRGATAVKCELPRATAVKCGRQGCDGSEGVGVNNSRSRDTTYRRRAATCSRHPGNLCGSGIN